MKEKKISSFYTKIPKVAAICILIIAGIIASLLFNINLSWLYYDSPYSKIGIIDWYAPLVRLLFITSGFIIGYSFLSLIPASSSIFTRFGSKTVYPYLLHFIVIRIIQILNIYPNNINSILLIAIAILFGIILTIILSSNITVFVLKPLIEPVAFFEKIIKK